MVKFTWVKGNVPNGMKITQVYGIVFSDDGRIVLMLDSEKFALIGGHPIEGESFEETLKREFIEELNIEIDNLEYLGYLKVEEENIEPYAQVRLIGRIKNIHENRPDTDNGKLYTRMLIGQNHVKQSLNYGIEGDKMLDDAISRANIKYGFLNLNEKGQVI